MSPERARRFLSAACVLGLAALALMVWSLFDPRPAPVILAMSVGQVIGTLAFAAFLVVVAADVRARLAPGGSRHENCHTSDHVHPPR